MFLLGLEEGSLPRRSQGSPFIADEERRSIDERSRHARLVKPDSVSRERFFFYTACTRPSQRLYLVREAASDEGSPREPSPFWDEVRALFPAEDVARWTQRRSLASLTWRLDEAPDRARAAPGAERARGDRCRRGVRARARERLGAPPRPRAWSVLAADGDHRSRAARVARARATFGVTELEGFADCSSIWFIERVISPRTIDGEVDPRLRGSIAHQTLYKFFSGIPKRLGIERLDAERLDDGLVFLRECLDRGDRERRLARAPRPPAPRARGEPVARPRAVRPRRSGVAARPRPAALRGLVRLRPLGARAPERAQIDGFALTGKIDRIDLDPFSARGIVQDYKSGKTAHSAAKIESELRLQIPLYMLVLRDLVGIEPLGGLYRALAGERQARGLLRAEAKDDVPGFAPRDYLDEEEFWAQTERAKEHARALRRGHPVGRGAARPEGRLPVPDLVRSVVDVPGGAVMTVVEETRAPNEEQLAAIDAGGLVFVSAGAGTGKTTVLVERFVRAVCDRGLPIDSVLAITYTERAAGELRGRIRRRLAELGRHDLARELDGAWISTIHGFCHRLLKAHPFEAGIDPRFRVLDENQSRVLAGEAFEQALEGFCASGDPERIRMLATYRARGLRRMLTGVYETLRSAGRDLVLEIVDRPGLETGSRSCARRRGASSRTRPEWRRPRRRAERGACDRPPGAPARGRPADRPLRLAARGGPRDRFASYEEARHAVEQAALDELAVRDRRSSRSSCGRFADAYAAAKEGESALDFEDLQLNARNLLRDHPAIRDRESWRFRSVLVDEFQDTNRLQCELIDLLATEDLFFVGDEFQSIYRFRHADVEVFRERREASGGVLALTENYRSRPEVLDVINHLFSADFGDSFQPLSAAGRFPDPAFGPAVELLVTDKASLQGHGHALARRRGQARGDARQGSRPGGRGDARRDRPPLRCRNRREALRGGSSRARAADLPRDRPRLLPPAAGRRPPRLPAAAAQPLRRRGARHRSRVAVRGRVERRAHAPARGAERRPLFVGLERSLPRGLSDRDARLFRAFKQRYDRWRVSRRGSRSSGSASAWSPTTTTTWPCSRSGTGGAATRTCASWRGSPARTRSCAAPTSRASCASSASRAPSARPSSRRLPRRRAPMSSGC